MPDPILVGFVVSLDGDPSAAGSLVARRAHFAVVGDAAQPRKYGRTRTLPCPAEGTVHRLGGVAVVVAPRAADAGRLGQLVAETTDPVVFVAFHGASGADTATIPTHAHRVILGRGNTVAEVVDGKVRWIGLWQREPEPPPVVKVDDEPPAKGKAKPATKPKG